MDNWQKKLVRLLFHYSARKLQIEHTFYIKNAHIPQRLYKYRSFCGEHKEALEKNVLWRCSPNKFNDPYDTAIYFNPDKLLIENRSWEDAIHAVERVFEEATPHRPKPIQNPIRFRNWRRSVLEEARTNAPEDLHAIPNGLAAVEEAVRLANERMIIQLSEHFRGGFSAVSLSEEPSSIRMWSHYSKNHTGFCIEYDFSTISPEDLRRRLCFPVYYRGKLTDATRYLTHASPENINIYFSLYLCLLKSDEWAYEKEWRIVYPTGQAQANAEISMPRPSAIILGARVDTKDKKWMVEYCNHNNLPLMTIRQERSSFKLEILPYCE